MTDTFLTRNEILTGNYDFPSNSINLIPTRHFWDRFKDRSNILYFPSTVQVTMSNIHSGKTRDGKSLHSVVIKLDYGSKWIFLCFNPWDHGLKTIWFKNKHKKWYRQKK